MADECVYCGEMLHPEVDEESDHCVVCALSLRTDTLLKQYTEDKGILP